MIVINLCTQLAQFSLITVNLEIFALKMFCKNFFMLNNFCREVSFQQFKNLSVNGMSQMVAPALFADEELAWPDPSCGSAVHPLVKVQKAGKGHILLLD